VIIELFWRHRIDQGTEMLAQMIVYLSEVYAIHALKTGGGDRKVGLDGAGKNW